MYGTQTVITDDTSVDQFENDVKMYGTQTVTVLRSELLKFENDVKMYGTQTDHGLQQWNCRLRMM